jgi:hypothetical protein
MKTAPFTAPVQAFAPDLARRVGLILAALADLIARRFLRDPRLVLLIIPFCTRLKRAARRFERLMVGLAAGTPPRPHRSGPGGPHRSMLPTGRGWLIRVLGYEAAGYASQLQALPAEPAAAELLALAPTAGRILRPLSRMLAIGAFAFRSRPARAAPAPPPALLTFGEPIFRSHGLTWYEVPTPALNSG